LPEDGQVGPKHKAVDVILEELEVKDKSSYGAT
jgi:hypothetical protein